MSIYEQSPFSGLSQDELAELQMWKTKYFPLSKDDVRGGKGRRWSLRRRIYDHVNQKAEPDPYVAHKENAQKTTAGVYFRLLDELMGYENLTIEEKDELLPEQGKQIIYRARERGTRYGDFSLRFIHSGAEPGKLVFANRRTKDRVSETEEFTIYSDGEFSRVCRTQVGGVIRSSALYTSSDPDEEEQRRAVQALLNTGNNYLKAKGRNL